MKVIVLFFCCDIGGRKVERRILAISGPILMPMFVPADRSPRGWQAGERAPRLSPPTCAQHSPKNGGKHKENNDDFLSLLLFHLF